METCPKCGSLLQINNSKYATENDDTPDLPTVIYIELSQACYNKQCENFVFADIKEPKILNIERNQVN